MTEPALPPLRDRLLVLRDSIVDAMESTAIVPGFLPMLARAKAALEALDAKAGETSEYGADRVVVADDGHEIRLALYRDGESKATASSALEPAYALTIAGKLLEAAGSHLRRGLGDA